MPNSNRELAKTYEPKGVEQKWYAQWEKEKLFHAPDTTPKSPYCIVIPPPNVTGALHMGHALNNTLQDILIRWRRMGGFEALWIPGTDHAGIATQNVVEREILEKEGKHRQELGREKLIEQIWKWREEYGDRILQQLRALGASCDWDRTRFTLDEGLSRAVRECFVRLYQEGLIYRGKYIVNWCPRCHTALADDEVEHEETKGKLWHLRYPLADGSGHIVVATTRPETMLGDTAVAVNPKDDRYAALIGKMISLPETNRNIPIIADDFVDARFGSGAVKVTPAHDPNDFQIGERHNLPRINIMKEDATMNDEAGENYKGLTREACRKKIVKAFEAQGLLEKIGDHVHAVGHCYRCNTIIEPWLSNQWFVRMKPLAQAAIRASEEKKISFHPERWERIYLQWLESVRDWCISRQIWWGHRIPVWYRKGADRTNPENFHVSIDGPTDPENWEQDEDVLDTWFSSALWPFSTLGWPDTTAALKTYYPTSTLVTDRGIIFFWVARMVMMGLKLMDSAPFSHVYIHGTILDELGRKMSKSLGNGIDPLEIIDQYGADAMRFSLVCLSTEGQDLKLSLSKFEMGRNFCNKLWNATRFSLMHLSDMPKTPALEKHLSLVDRWILNRLAEVTRSTRNALEHFHFNDAAQGLYHFVWNDLCDWYLEAAKPTLAGSGTMRSASQATLFTVLSATLKLLHPFLPFMTEELWHALSGKETSIMREEYPHADTSLYQREAQEFEVVKSVIAAIRNIRGEHRVAPSKKINAIVIGIDEAALTLLRSMRKTIMDLAKVNDFEVGSQLEKPSPAATAVVGELEILVPHEGLIDTEAERARLQKEMERAQTEIEATQKKLSNPSFTEKAPKAVVDEQRARLAEVTVRLEKLTKAFKSF